MTLLSHADYERIAANLSYPTEAFIGGTFAPASPARQCRPSTPRRGKEIARVASCGARRRRQGRRRGAQGF